MAQQLAVGKIRKKSQYINGREHQDLMRVGDLIATHEDYDANVGEWAFTMALYEGIREVIRLRLIRQNERESDRAYQRRLNELYGFGYSKSVVEIFLFYLFKKEVKQIGIDELLGDELYQLFQKDADQYGNDLNAVEMEFAMYAGVNGHSGILVDKPSVNGQTRKQQIDNKIYPYLAIYRAPSILDWAWGKDSESKRPKLMWLKLFDEDKRYRIWTPDYWEIWELPTDSDGNYDKTNEQAEAVFVDGNYHHLGEIPFVWHYNLRSRVRNIGSSDIHEVSRIDLSIIKNCSQMEKVIDWAAFPMMRKPQRDARPIDINVPQQDDEVGVDVILEFDPEHPDSKPDWLEAEVKEPVEATISFMERKIAEIYRACNIGGMAATEPTRNPQSGVAKRIDFQLLNSKLVSKAINLEDTENKIHRFWLMWEKKWNRFRGILKFIRDKEFDLQSVAEDLENALTSKTIVMSETFQKLLQQQTARQMLPGASESELIEIDKEIEKNTKMDVNVNSDSDLDNDNLDDDTRKIRDQGGVRNVEDSNLLPSSKQDDDVNRGEK